MQFKKGQIVRYGQGPTALCRLSAVHQGATRGWQATLFSGVSDFVAEGDLSPASAADVQSFVDEQRRRSG
jgi:hypothetical protein